VGYRTVLKMKICHSDCTCFHFSKEFIMGMLSDIFHKIFPASHPAVKSQKPAAPQASPTATAAPKPASQPTATASTTTSTTSVLPPTENIPEVDVEEMLNAKAKTAGQPLNWRSSIVDLLKLLDLDSSLQARKELAAELGYTGDTNDSATMNIWLHRQVMNKLAANGGKVPADLKD
jgi:hypothetical protein